MRIKDLISALRDLPDDIDVSVRIDLSKDDDEETMGHRAEGNELIEVLTLRGRPNGRILRACIFVGNGKEWK